MGKKGSEATDRLERSPEGNSVRLNGLDKEVEDRKTQENTQFPTSRN